jgi:hypothetical protein
VAIVLLLQSLHSDTICLNFHTEVCRLVEGAEVYTVVIIIAIVLVYTDSHNTMATTV